jgi:hypothetical protein
MAPSLGFYLYLFPFFLSRWDLFFNCLFVCFCTLCQHLQLDTLPDRARPFPSRGEADLRSMDVIVAHEMSLFLHSSFLYSGDVRSHHCCCIVYFFPPI